MKWLKGLVAAAISGAATAMAAMFADPDHFNMANPKKLGMIAGAGAIVGVGGYLKQSPLPSPGSIDVVSDAKRATLPVLWLIVGLSLMASACTQPDLPTLLQYAQFGIDADCQFGKGALAADVCTFGKDAIDAAQAAYAHDPAHGVAAVKKILVDAETRQPALAPYTHWSTVRL